MKKILLLCFSSFFIVLIIIFLLKENMNLNLSNENNGEVITIEDIQENTEIYEESTESEADMEIEYYNLIEGARHLSGHLSILDEYVDSAGKMNIYSISELGINQDYVTQITDSLVNSGWNRLECNIFDDYSFVLKSETIGSAASLDEKECREQTEIFLESSGLIELFKNEGIEYEIQSTPDSGLNQTFCYLLYKGERTGSYIRFVFQGRSICEECQAYLYRSDAIGSADIIPLEDALTNAFYIGSGKDNSIDSNDYSIANIEIKYRNGVPYYSFTGYGENTRTAITGYSLAIDIETFDGSPDMLYEAIGAWAIN